MRAVAAVWLLPLLLACAPERREPAPLEIETVEVGASVDAELSTEEDETGGPSGDSGWILSGMLPEDLPLHRPARLVDSGETADGRRYFVFHTSTRLDAVRGGLEQQLAAAGWTPRPAGEGLSVRKGAESVDFSFAALRPGTEIRVVY